MATVRIQGVPLSPNKHIRIALTDIYGIGGPRALKICESAGIEPQRKVSELSDQEVHRVAEECGRYRLEGELRREVQLAVKRLRDIGCYRGLRHRNGLPVRGQRTRTNARTRKGPRGSRVGKK
ncbi:MAG TPA: 30S ribosomal protein S13 [Gammaproteobacteria bacterium]|nr:30S ribosomal protein S13 [Gammaproteobacteria bacterium]